MVVYVNLDKPLISQVVRFGYGRYGHLKDLCPNKVKNLVQNERKTSMEASKRTDQATTKEVGAYGPWMIVERKNQ
ncbi:hypothetical protein GOBAR_AA34767 [Gossypium barbadense]|uniref:DUF4283 domain-containing protein n=1 Tax=Gossypium barbadense TaxID=3634 RepID=A0A2P5W4E4_GOSBA|nr:hypothetical protein GOBAR_AA34767 [Gossypium barbadense]